VKYVTRRFSSAGDAKQNAVAVWGTGSEPRRQSDLHWNGTKWANCDINFEHTATVRDAKGRNSYNYCDNREIGTTLRANVDVSGAPMIGMYKAIRSAGYNNLKIGESDNIAAEQLLSNSIFPANSQIQYTAFTTTDFAISYYPGTDNAVALSPAAVAAGDKTACEKDNGTSNILATTLEDLVSRGTGTPCVFAANASTGARNEGWGSTVMSMGTVGTMSTQTVATETLTAANYYTSNRRLRVAFGANNAANYYSCQERLNASTRNCDLVGTGSYAIETLGDARVMTFNGLPPIFSTLDYTRVFVERAGKIWHGYKVRPRVSKQARLNTAAAKAILTQLNLNTDFSAGTNTDPETQLKPTKASYQGVWNLSFGTASGPKPDVTVKDDGSIGCKIATTDPALATGCVAYLSSSGLLTLTKTATGFDPALTTSIQLDFLSGTGTGSYEDFVSKTNGTAGAARK
jgi:trimeric autotransporter adhesin